MFYSQKFVLLVYNAIIHLHPESICFIMYYSKENFILFIFPCEHCPKSFASRKYLLHDVILKRKLYSPKFLFLVNNALQGKFWNSLSYYLFLDSILIRCSFHYMIRIFWMKSIYDLFIESVTEAICDSYLKHESQSFAHVY